MQVNLLNCFNKNQDKISSPEVQLFSFVMINIDQYVLNNTISPFKSTYSTVTNNNSSQKTNAYLKSMFFSVHNPKEMDPNFF